MTSSGMKRNALIGYVGAQAIRMPGVAGGIVGFGNDETGPTLPMPSIEV